MRCLVSLLAAGLIASLAPAAGDPPAAPPRAAGDRGTISPDGAGDPAVLDRYAAALRYSRQSLDAETANAVAAAIIASSNERALDARLVVAAVVAEGMLGRVGTRQGELRIGGRDAVAVVAGLAADLGRRIDAATRLAKRAQPTMVDIGHALAERATRRLYPHDPRGTAAKAYPKRVIRLYYQLCGYDPAATSRPGG